MTEPTSNQNNISLEKITEGLERIRDYDPMIRVSHDDVFRQYAVNALALIKSLLAFKEYFDNLYGQGLEVANWHMNGTMEPFDNFYDSAMEEYENA